MGRRKKEFTKNKESVFDKLYREIVTPLFENIADKRRENLSYNLTDVLKSGFAIYSLKFASLFSFQKKSKAENSNLAKVYGIKKIPSDNGLRKILDEVLPSQLRKGFHQLFLWIKKQGILKDYKSVSYTHLTLPTICSV